MDCQDYITELVERKKGQHLQREERGAIQHLNDYKSTAKGTSTQLEGGEKQFFILFQDVQF